MALFQTKKIQSFIVFIIILASILWIFQDNFLKLLAFQKVSEQSILTAEEPEETAYLEKIDNFILKEYSNEQVLLHTIQADTYYSYKNSPVQIVDVEVKTFNEKQEEGLVLRSNRAEILKSGEMFFNGEVKIQTKTGVSHELDTESLIVLSDNGQIKSNKEVTYLGETVRIISEGMEMNIDSDTMYLSGNVKIVEDSGMTVDTKNLYISHNAGEKIYKSKEKTVYRSKDTIVNSENGIDMDMNIKLINLLGKVEIVSGPGDILKSSNVVIDQSNDGEVLKSNSLSHFKSDTVDIKAKKMHYDAVTKKLELMNKVVAVYE
ncbi:MAG: LPS export ABC transporter periplasmic protein LptC [Gammaproteobacteria bacterium]|jgi:LPS export ABC transporter protein LptC|nr:LPS export ABC transporter periplasmic protein LptC [Gammaproteobacteria bacterium]MBT6141981.1 LPS export ABC transporter periplasmic protein LptC [Gammaproteobacteria bacterium]MBT7391047.1 LPS export ABC transporter periplasmic protein LptC [Gammaproteobacteria bacterium]MDO7701521.1 LPS export ABC transporter periplasmic protein LptC [SAR86 cluster bacterium]